MYLLIPVDLCSYTITNSFYSPFQVYIYLKSICSGKLKLRNEDLKIIAGQLQIKSSKTIRSNIKILIERNWIGYNAESGYYFIRGFNAIMKMLRFYRRTAAEFNTTQINNLNEFLTGAFIGKLNNDKKWKLREVERKKRRSKQASRKFPEYFPIANNYLSKILHISKNKAFRLKNEASKKGYILTRKVFHKTNVHAKHIVNYLEGYPEHINKAKIIGKNVFLQECDEVKSLVHFKRRKKIEPYKKGCRKTKG